MFAGVDFTRTSQAGIFGVSMDDVVILEVGSLSDLTTLMKSIIMTTTNLSVAYIIGDSRCLEVS